MRGLSVDASSGDSDWEVGRMPSSSEDGEEFLCVVDHKRIAEAEERFRWDRGVARRAKAFAKLQSTFAKERAAWDRNRARQDAEDVRSLIAVRAPPHACPAEQTAAGREAGLVEAALRNARSRYKASSAAVAAKARAAMDAAVGQIGCWPAIPPPTGPGQIAPASDRPEPASVAEGRLRAEAEEQRYLNKTAARYGKDFAQLQTAIAAGRASWQRRATREDRRKVRECISRAARSGPLARAEVEIDCLRKTLAKIRDKYRTREEDAACKGRQAMYDATREPPGQRSEL